jgi:hypothetical protein
MKNEKRKGEKVKKKPCGQLPVGSRAIGERKRRRAKVRVGLSIQSFYLLSS